MPRADLMRRDGENMAVRCFLMVYGTSASYTVGQMRKQMDGMGWDGCWPDWVNTEHPDAHLTKAGAQDWLRHLFTMERTEVAWLCPADPDVASAFKWPKEGVDYSNLSCDACGGKHVPVFAHLPPEAFHGRTGPA